jgi:thiol-disulfide isomerase/thioredoxin
MKSRVVILALALVLLIGGGSVLYDTFDKNSETPWAPETEEVAPRTQAPDFIVEDNDGNEVKLSDMFGSPIVINFWASWCPPCKSEMPDFDKVFGELKDSVIFVMVNAVGARGETKDAGAKYVAEEGFRFPVYYDMNQDAVTQYGIRAFPTSFFIDEDGYIAAGIEGAISEAVLRQGIDLIIK